MLSNKQIICPNNLLDASIKKKGATAAIVNAGKPLPMQSVMDAVKEDLIKPIFIGDKSEIEKCANEIQFDISSYQVIHEPVENNTAAVAAKLAMQGKVKIIVKGHIHTDILMKEVLKREYKLLGKTRLSHVWHMTLEKDDNPIISVEIYAEVCDKIFQTVQNASLARLASEGHLEFLSVFPGRPHMKRRPHLNR